MTIQNEGIGYKDLDALFAKPCDLEFIIGKFVVSFCFLHLFFLLILVKSIFPEIISIECPSDYEKESWQLNDTEKTVAITRFREEGNELYRHGNHTAAEAKYKVALGMIEQLLMKYVFHRWRNRLQLMKINFPFDSICREKPHDTEWSELVKIKIPLLLNYSQCKLLQKDYYAVIEHCTEVLQHEPDSVKALYRRAKAHVGAWNPDDAKKDYQKCLDLDKSLKTKITRELDDLNEQIKLNELNNKMKYQNMFE